MRMTRRFKQVVTQELLNRFNVEEAIEGECVTVFATILDPRYRQLKFLSDKIKAKVYLAFREKFTSIIATEDCQIVEDLSHDISQEYLLKRERELR